MTLAAIFDAALTAVDPIRSVSAALMRMEGRFSGFADIIVLGAGKAAARMALGAEQVLGNRISAGLVVVKRGCREHLSFVEQVEASHPLPDAAGMNGTRRILELARNTDENTLIICLLSGGASSLLVSPVEGISLEDKRETARLLMNSGAAIDELNAVRKHLSRVKGGRLAIEAYPAEVIALILSDVIGDRLDVIASGPTCADESTFERALNVIGKYGLHGKLPANVVSYLEAGRAGLHPETAKAGDTRLEHATHLIVGGIGLALAAAQNRARELGFETRVVTQALRGEASEAAKFLANIARSASADRSRKYCLLCGGETTVTVRGAGKGGRNQELALAFCLEIEGQAEISLLSAGTDGADGLTDAAGAIVDGRTAQNARSLGIDPLSYLENNDSWSFFENYDVRSGARSHFKTGPTGTNVMDLQIILTGETRG